VGKSSRADSDRRARVEEMRRRQQASERRRTFLVLGAALVVVLVLVGLVAFAIIDFRRDNPALAATSVADVGVDAAAASCDDVVSEPAEGVNAHIGPGTDTPDKTRVEYPSAPPSFGEHFASPQYPAAEFYTAQDRPAMESLVHNLEHGYTIVWYTEDLPAAQQDELRRISELARDMDETAGKFVVSAWDAGYGDFPEGKQVAISHWGASDGHRQYCGSVSGAVIQQFVEDYPYTDSPEPNAQ
jgi:Protein of unknown function (DUF3105)